jgi:hypothetical protein
MPLVSVDSILNRDTPQAEYFVPKNPKFNFLGVNSQEEIDSTVFTQVEITPDDIKKNKFKGTFPKLLFVNKSAYLNDQSIVKDLANIVIIAKPGSYNEGFITHCTEECNKTLQLIMNDNYLVIRCTIGDGYKLINEYNCKTAKYFRYGSAFGNLIISDFNIVDMYVLGNRCLPDNAYNRSITGVLNNDYYSRAHTLRNSLQRFLQEFCVNEACGQSVGGDQ